MIVSPIERSVSPPKTAVWLGAFGVIPFATLTAAAWMASENNASAAMGAVVAYGAVILSFLGGAHWGFASNGMRDQSAPAARLLTLSVVPSLAGWLALLVPAPWSAALLGAAFAAVLPLDRWAMTRSLAPAWWMRLRAPLSAIVSTLLFMAFASALARFGP